MESSTTRRSFLLGLAGASAAAALTLAGCGSGGSSSAKGKGVTAKVVVLWPKADSRYIATNVDLIKVACDQTATDPTDGILFFEKPTTGADAESVGYYYGLPADTEISMTATAYQGFEASLDGVTSTKELEAAYATATTPVATSNTDKKTGAQGDTLIFSLVLASAAKRIVVTFTDEFGAKYKMAGGMDGTSTVTLPTDTKMTVTVSADDGDGNPVFMPDGTWAVTYDETALTAAEDGSYTFTTPSAPGEKAVVATWTPTNDNDSSFFPTGTNPNTVTVTVVQAYQKIKFTATLQGDNVASIIDANFTWTTDGTTFGKDTYPSTTADNPALTLKSGDTVWAATAGQNVTLSFTNDKWILKSVKLDTKDLTPTTPVTGNNTIALAAAAPNSLNSYAVVYQANPATGVNGNINIS